MSNNELHVRWADGEATFTPPGPVFIGRDPDCAIVLSHPGVSRRHAEVLWADGEWRYQDLSSSQGSFREGVGITSVVVDGSVKIVTGQGKDAPWLTLSAATTHPLPPTELPGMAEPTSLPDGAHNPAGGGGLPSRPGGALRQGPVQATVVSGNGLRVECGGKTFEFLPGDQPTIGRDDDCEVQATNPIVSRRHAQIAFEDGAWQLTDLGSTAGTFLDGRRITRQTLRGSMALWLGEPDVGERIVVVTGGVRKLGALARIERAGRGGRSTVLVGLVALLVVALGAGGLTFFLTRSSGGLNHETLAKATVEVDAPGQYHGSGTIIDAKRGLILTNAHVAAPASPGRAVSEGLPGSDLEAGPAEFIINVAPHNGQAAEPRYLAVPVAVDGYLDVAVLKITKTVAGALVQGDLTDLTAVHVGNSDKLASGDKLTVVGYPSVARSTASTVSAGVVSGFEQEDRLNTNRAEINTDAEINPGNSGGLAADSHGNIVGIPSALRPAIEPGSTESTGKVGIVRPINLAAPLIAAAEAGRTYTSPYLTPLSGSETVKNFRTAAPVDGLAFGCTEASATPSKAISLAFDYSGFPTGQHQDLLVQLQSNDKVDAAKEANALWPYRWQGSGCASVTFTFDDVVPDGAYTVKIFAGPDYKLLDTVTVRIGAAGDPGTSGSSGTSGSTPATT